jgi:hypothetical protein
MSERSTLILALSSILSTALFVSGCSSKTVHIVELVQPSPALLDVRYAIDGSFSSAAQASDDPDNFRDIRLEMRHIWPELDVYARPRLFDRDGQPIESTRENPGIWVYVEQAAAESLDRPYRQRIYRFRPLGAADIWESTIYELPGDSLRFAGAHNDPSLLDGLTPFDLIKRDGCEVILYHDSGELGHWTITGGTVSTRCASDWGGAAYATSEVTITRDAMFTWDRGFAADGTQVWGSTAGAYRFDRVEDDAGAWQEDPPSSPTGHR